MPEGFYSKKLKRWVTKKEFLARPKQMICGDKLLSQTRAGGKYYYIGSSRALKTLKRLGRS